MEIQDNLYSKIKRLQDCQQHTHRIPSWNNYQAKRKTRLIHASSYRVARLLLRLPLAEPALVRLFDVNGAGNDVYLNPKSP